MNNKFLNERGKKVLSPVLGRYSELEIISGHGCYLIGTDGEKYLDFASGIAVTSTGHCHPMVVKAIQKQAEQLIHTCLGVAFYEQPIYLAEKLTELTQGKLSAVFFTQSGSEAVEASIKLAKYATKKSGIIAFTGGFHGRTLGALSITTSKEKYRQGYEPLLENINFIDYPYCYRCPWGKNKNNCNLFCLGECEKIIANHAQNTATVIIEPVLGEGGYIPAPDGFLAGLYNICKKYDILLILDEVQTGFGRSGNWFSYLDENFIPDIVALAKGIASGMPLGASIAKPNIAKKWKPSTHGGTYGGNPVTTVAGLATIEVLNQFLPKITTLSNFAKNYLEKNLGDHPNVGDIRIKGLMIGIEFVEDKKSKKPAPQIAKNMINLALKDKLVIISCGIYDNVIRLIPALIIDQKTLKKGLDIFIYAFLRNYKG